VARPVGSKSSDQDVKIVRHPKAMDQMSLHWWVPGQSLKEYGIEFMRDEAWRLEHIAQKLADGRLSGKNQQEKVLRFARRLGCSSRHVLRIMAQPEMMARVRDLIKMKALYGTAKALSAQIEKAETDPAAFKTLLQVGKVLEVGGPKVEINTTIDRRNGGDNEAAVQFIERFRERSRQGALRARNAVDVTPEMVNEPESDLG
jgi:hypothetical protein